MKSIIFLWFVLVISLVDMAILKKPYDFTYIFSKPATKLVVSKQNETPVVNINGKQKTFLPESSPKKSERIHKTSQTKENTYTSTPDTTPQAQKTPATKSILPAQKTLTAPDSETFSEGTLRLRKALVNIICTVSAGTVLRSISGSGVIISSKGVVLTNAHIGQYFLLSDYPSKGNTSCVIRTGSPAKKSYSAELMFISPAWIKENPATLTKYAPSGTGEHDIALLSITKSLTSTPLPNKFPFVELSRETPRKDSSVVIGSYAAQFLTVNEIRDALYPTIAYGKVHEVFTFGTNTIDLISLGGNAAAQEGSSGGGVIDLNGKLEGLITTSTTQGATQTRDLHAITAMYIRHDYAKEATTSLDAILAEQPETVVTGFAPEAKKLTAVLVKILSSASN